MNLVIDPKTYVIAFDFAIGGDFRDPVEIRIRDLPAVEQSEVDSFWIEAGDENVRVWDEPIGEPGSNVLDWFTTISRVETIGDMLEGSNRLSPRLWASVETRHVSPNRSATIQKPPPRC